MKPTPSHDPLDDLIAAALHGDLTPEERTQFEIRLQTDAAARAAYQEAQLMHDLLEKTYQEAQPDPNFEQRMVSGVRRKLQQKEQHQETAWESVVMLWKWVRERFRIPRGFGEYMGVGGLIASVMIVCLIGLGNQVKSVFTTISSQLAMAQSASDNYSYQALARRDRYPQGQTHKVDSLKDAGQLPGTSEKPKTYLPLAAAAPAPPVDVTTTTSTYAGGTTTPVPTSMSLASNEPREEAAKSELKAKERDNDAPADMLAIMEDKKTDAPATPAPNQPAPVVDNRKLIRNAQLELEVKSFQSTVDQIAALTKAAGGYVDTTNSERGGNGKLQGTVVAKVLPQNLDSFLLKLRDLGQLKNQTLSTDDVTKAYIDTQARLDNSRRMEAQLQELLKKSNGKVSELLQVERELGRVRGEIEQMQGELRLYDFQVQYATVTMQVSEKDLNQTAAYLLKETDNFSLFATNVEEVFQQARHAAEDSKGNILVANLSHNSGSDVSAELVVTVPPEQIDVFLAQIKSLGRVANFTRQTHREAKDGGDSDRPADRTLTEKDKVTVNVSIRSDDESRKQVALTVVAAAVDAALDQAKSATLASAGAEILSSSLNKTPQGQSTAQLSVRVPGKNYHALLDAFRALGRTSSFSLQRDDNSGPGASGDDAPVIIAIVLTDDEAPLQQTYLSVMASNVDDLAQQLKKNAADAGVEVKASSFARQPDGTELAQMTFRLPMSKYPAFVAALKKTGRVEAFTVNRQDRPDQTRIDDSAPAEINLNLHNQGNLVTDDNGFWATLRRTFGEGMGALFGSIRVIGVLIAFLAPWVIVLGLVAWIGRRIYIARRK